MFQNITVLTNRIDLLSQRIPDLSLQTNQVPIDPIVVQDTQIKVYCFQNTHHNIAVIYDAIRYLQYTSFTSLSPNHLDAHLK